MSVESIGNYKFILFKCDDDYWRYEIYGKDYWRYDDPAIISEVGYDSEQEARFAAIGHVSLLENGE